MMPKNSIHTFWQSNTEEDGRKLKNIYIDLIMKTIVGLVLT